LLGKGIAFLLGVSSLLLIHSKDMAVLIGLIVITCFIVVNLQQGIKALTKKLLLNYILAGLLWSCLSILLWFYCSSQTITTPLKAEVEGFICSIPDNKSQRLQFDFCIDSVNNRSVSLFQFSRIRFTWGKYSAQPVTKLAAGQKWLFTAKLKPPHGRYNPAGFDYQKWMLSEHYAASGQVISASQIDEVGLSKDQFSVKNLRIKYYQVRQSVFDELEALIPDNQFQGLLIALGVGERGGISQQQWDVLRQSGTSHLLAISGLHVGVAALWCYWVVLWSWKRSEKLCLLFPAQKAGQIASILGGLSILLISGMGLPAQRAFIMLSVFIFSRWSGRYYQLSSVLGIALFVILLWDPLAVLSASFWLSFYAVLIIALSLNQKAVNNDSSFKPKLLTWLRINGYLFVAMLPISVIFFDMFSLVAIFANLILIPVASFLLIPLLYSSMLLMVLSESLASWLYILCSKVIELVYWLQLNLAVLNGNIGHKNLNNTIVFLLVMIVCLLLLPKRSYSKLLFMPIILLTTMALFSSDEANRSKTEKMTLTIFDIGQGLSVYIETPEANALYDTGWGNKEYALANSTIIPLLEKKGIKTIDKMIISHADSDHLGGLSTLYDKYIIDELITGEPIKGRQSRNCHNYPDWRWGKIAFKFLQHLPEARREGNNASCVLSIETSKGNVLLTGDIEEAAEQVLVNNKIKQHDILIAPHHGSKTSSTPEFISQLAPKQVIFSTGYNNQWRFPKAEVVERYLAINSRIWVTHEDGAIIINLEIEDESLSISSVKVSNPHFWH